MYIFTFIDIDNLTHKDIYVSIRIIYVITMIEFSIFTIWTCYRRRNWHRSSSTYYVHCAGPTRNVKKSISFLPCCFFLCFYRCSAKNRHTLRLLFVVAYTFPLICFSSFKVRKSLMCLHERGKKWSNEKVKVPHPP